MVIVQCGSGERQEGETEIFVRHSSSVEIRERSQGSTLFKEPDVKCHLPQKSAKRNIASFWPVYRNFFLLASFQNTQKKIEAFIFAYFTCNP